MAERPIKRILNIKEMTCISCEMRIENTLNGEKEIKFVPERDFYFSCWMGMINGYVKVVDDINIDEIKKEVKEFELPAGSGGCCG